MTQVAEFQDRLRQIMEENHETGNELAPKVNISKQAIYAYMNGTRSPKTPVVSRIAAHYGVSIPWLCGFDVPKYDKAATTEDKELDDLLEMYRTRDDCRILFELARDATPDDVRLAASILEKLHDKEGR
jgi:transcriptional regulator with XRE-family HTH domain